MQFIKDTLQPLFTSKVLHARKIFIRVNSISQLPHVWGPKIIIPNSNKTTTWCGSKGGSGRQSAPLKLKRSAPCTPGFLRAIENLPPGWYTHRYGGGSWADCDRSWVNMEGAQTDIGEGVGPPFRVGCDQSWASLGPPITYMYIPGVQNVVSTGAKVWRKEHFIPIPNVYWKMHY